MDPNYERPRATVNPRRNFNDVKQLLGGLKATNFKGLAKMCFFEATRKLRLQHVRLAVQGGIVLTSPPCHKKHTSGLTDKALSVYQTRVAKWAS